MRFIRLHGAWSRLVQQPSGYLFFEPVPTPPVRDDKLDAVLATISGSPLF